MFNEFGNLMKNCLVFASLISPSKMILFEIFNSLLGVSSGDETLHLMLGILHL